VNGILNPEKSFLFHLVMCDFLQALLIFTCRCKYLMNIFIIEFFQIKLLFWRRMCEETYKKDLLITNWLMFDASIKKHIKIYRILRFSLKIFTYFLYRFYDLWRSIYDSSDERPIFIQQLKWNLYKEIFRETHKICNISLVKLNEGFNEGFLVWFFFVNNLLKF
jgi:hypothetical protein